MLKNGPKLELFYSCKGCRFLYENNCTNLDKTFSSDWNFITPSECPLLIEEKTADYLIELLNKDSIPEKTKRLRSYLLTYLPSEKFDVISNKLIDYVYSHYIKDDIILQILLDFSQNCNRLENFKSLSKTCEYLSVK